MPGIRALLEWDGLDELTDLDLSRNDLGIAEVQALVESPRLGRLRHLRLGYCRNEDPNYRIGEVLAALPGRYRNYDEEGEWQYGPGGNYFPLGRLARIIAPLSAQLSDLELGACAITHLGLQDFTATPRALTRLSLHHNFLGLPGSRALADSPLAARLTNLDLSSCYIDDRSLAVLARCPRLAGLTVLELGNHRLSEEGVWELLGATFAARLVRLGLAGSWSEYPGLVDSPEDASRIQDAGVKILAEGAGRLPRLAWLDLRKGGLTAAAARILADSPLLERLAWLDLRRNRLGDEGASILAALRPWPRLARLDLRDNGISPAIGHRLRARFGERVLYSSRTPTIEAG
jgi:hypothetical protein